MRIHRLRPHDLEAVVAAGPLFDDPVDPETTRDFLADERHHLLIAYEDERPVGFVSGVELLHPDKRGPEMFLYELGVHEDLRGRGIGRALVEALAHLAWERDCYGAFVLTDEANTAAMATYRSAGGRREPNPVMIAWVRPDPASQPSPR
jgi:ribosomal protein S18 acetylase RimI-like enzyme